MTTITMRVAGSKIAVVSAPLAVPREKIPSKIPTRNWVTPSIARTKPLFGFAPSPLKIRRKARTTSTTAKITPTIHFEVLLSAFVSWVSVCWVIVPPPVSHADLIGKKKPSSPEHVARNDDANPGIRRLMRAFSLDVFVPPNQIHHNGNNCEHEKKVNPSTQRI